MTRKEDYLVDCMITAGELDPNWYGHFLDNELHVVEVAKHNVPYSEFQKWVASPEMQKRVEELESIGRKKFGSDYYMKYRVCYFCTISHKD